LHRLLEPLNLGGFYEFLLTPKLEEILDFSDVFWRIVKRGGGGKEWCEIALDILQKLGVTRFP